MCVSSLLYSNLIENEQIHVHTDFEKFILDEYQQKCNIFQRHLHVSLLLYKLIRFCPIFATNEILFYFVKQNQKKKKKMPHSHDHGNGCSHEASHTDDAFEMGIQYSLFSKIDMENLECLNEESDGSGKSVFKSFEQRLNFDKVNVIYLTFLLSTINCDLFLTAVCSK